MPSFACVLIHWESKFCWDRYPVKAAPTETTNDTTPVIQVARRRPRQAAMKNFPHRWTTMAKKNTSTLHRWSELTNSPVDETCHHVGPKTASTMPVTITTPNAANVTTPKT